MAIRPDTRNGKISQAELAWEAYRAILMHQLVDPKLQSNPAWTMIRQDAYAQFCEALNAE
jgi:hypothetical protein